MENLENIIKMEYLDKTGQENDEVMDLVFVLDKSGSMYILTEDTIGGFNSLIEKQRQFNPSTRVSLVLFDTKYRVIYTRKPITEVEKLTSDVYYASGCTVLLDAVGTTINRLDRETSAKVLFVISTDGLENSSREYTKKDIRNMIENHDWEFIFLGANIDSFAEAGGLGIPASHAANYDPSHDGVDRHWRSVSKASRSVFSGRPLCYGEWKEDLE